jgi:hypothetical protein
MPSGIPLNDAAASRGCRAQVVKEWGGSSSAIGKEVRQ